ncbi:MAG: helix-turn-helix transcriptional regulator [Dehalococcoidia bacterium]|nr:helix-turn-helix transcriptional regulator [Dehalococcoidia bacterium]
MVDGPAAAYPDGLSEREVEVLRLIAAGRSNAEIAEGLFISPHTVGRHVSNIFGKLGIANRADAAAWAVRNGLAE